MSNDRTSEILEEWAAVAHRDIVPPDAPKPAGSSYPLGVVALAAVLIILFVAVQGRAPVASVGAPIASASPVGSSSTGATIAPSNATGGACSPNQFALGTARSEFGYGAFNSTVVFVRQPLRNAGGDCLLTLPTEIRVASGAGPLRSVSVVNGGTATSFTLRAGQSVSILIGDSWNIGPMPSELEATRPACADPINEVDRVELPFGPGSITIDLPTAWREVCPAPTSVSVTIEN